MGLPTNKHRRSDKDREAYLAGRLAREQGRAIGANPHATGTTIAELVGVKVPGPA
jgi:hypothetical protein